VPSAPHPGSTLAFPDSLCLVGWKMDWGVGLSGGLGEAWAFWELAAALRQGGFGSRDMSETVSMASRNFRLLSV